MEEKNEKKKDVESSKFNKKKKAYEKSLIAAFWLLFSLL